MFQRRKIYDLNDNIEKNYYRQNRVYKTSFFGTNMVKKSRQ